MYECHKPDTHGQIVSNLLSNNLSSMQSSVSDDDVRLSQEPTLLTAAIAMSDCWWQDGTASCVCVVSWTDARGSSCSRIKRDVNDYDDAATNDVSGHAHSELWFGSSDKLLLLMLLLLLLSIRPRTAPHRRLRWFYLTPHSSIITVFSD